MIDPVTNLQRASHLVPTMSETSMALQSTRSLSLSSHQGSYFQPTRSMYFQINSPITWLPTASTGPSMASIRLPAFSSQYWSSNLTSARYSPVDWTPTPSFTVALTSTQQNTVSSWSTKYFTNEASFSQYTPSDLSSMSSNEYSPSPSSLSGMLSLSSSQYLSGSLVSSSIFFI